MDIQTDSLQKSIELQPPQIKIAQIKIENDKVVLFPFTENSLLMLKSMADMSNTIKRLSRQQT